MGIIMIGVIGTTNKDVVGYRLLDKETGNIKDVTTKSLEIAINHGVKIENVIIDKGSLKGTNGTLTRYPLIINDIPYKKSPLIVLKEMNNGDYMVSDFKGEVVRMRLGDVVDYSSTEGISNGKVVNREGTTFISAISGEFDKEPKIDVNKNAEKLEVKWDLLEMDYGFNSNKELVITNKELESIKVPSGVNRISEGCFRGMLKLKRVVLPNNLEYIGKQAFSSCAALEDVTIPNGITVIPRGCFSNCISLKEIEVPETVKNIESGAFRGCKNLKLVKLRSPNTQIEFSALPSGCRKALL